MKLSVIYVLVTCDAHTIDETYNNNNNNDNDDSNNDNDDDDDDNNNNNNNNNALSTAQFISVLCRKVVQL
jgi:hypothetical protein